MIGNLHKKYIILDRININFQLNRTSINCQRTFIMMQISALHVQMSHQIRQKITPFTQASMNMYEICLCILFTKPFLKRLKNVIEFQNQKVKPFWELQQGEIENLARQPVSPFRDKSVIILIQKINTSRELLNNCWENLTTLQVFN